MGNYPIVVLDFETTGLSPRYGDRTIEVGAILIENNEIVDRFQSLMNPGRGISGFIERYTGITNEMLNKAPPVGEVMHRFADFIGKHRLVAHNASFDRAFLDSELHRINRPRRQEFACSMLTARRVYPQAPDHKLGTLVEYVNIRQTGRFHRALSDAEMTGCLWMCMLRDIKAQYGFEQVPFEVMQKLMRVSKAAAPDFLKRMAAG